MWEITCVKEIQKGSTVKTSLKVHIFLSRNMQLVQQTFFDACVLLLVTSCIQSLDPKFKWQNRAYLISVTQQIRRDLEEVTNYCRFKLPYRKGGIFLFVCLFFLLRFPDNSLSKLLLSSSFKQSLCFSSLWDRNSLLQESNFFLISLLCTLCYTSTLSRQLLHEFIFQFLLIQREIDSHLWRFHDIFFFTN